MSPASADKRYTEAVAFLRTVDDDWKRIIDRIGPCGHDPKAAREPYEALIRAVAYQQLTARAGDAILARFQALFPDIPFPTPSYILDAGTENLRACGFSARKIVTVRAIAEGALSGLVPSRHQAVDMEDEDLIDRITTIHGIGRWTVEMLLMYTLERPDILPVDDFGIREGYRALKGLPVQPKPRILKDLSRDWAPYRTVASWYLWRMPRNRGNVLP